MPANVLNRDRINKAKRAFSTRRVATEAAETLITGDVQPVAGDLVLARVDALGKQTRLELTDGRRAHLFPGDEIVVSYGNRYAPDQYEAFVSDDLSPCDLVAAGGVAGIERARHVRIKPPTQISPIGLLGDGKGNVLNLRNFRVEADDTLPEMPIILSLGTSMNAGKTLTSTSLVRGFKQMGLRVAALKITGTGSGGDMWIVRDAGAAVVLDFTDAGFASTYLTPIDDIRAGAFRLINHAAALGCDVAVIEIADGLLQEETAQLIRCDHLRELALGCTFASYDAMGAICGVRELQAAGHHVLGISGRLGMSPLAVREAEAITGLRVYSPQDLQEGALLPAIQRLAVQRYAKSRFQRGSLRSLARAVAGEPRSAHEETTLTMDLSEQLPKGISNGLEAFDRVRDILARAAAGFIAAEVDELCGAGQGSRSEGRTDYRNGFRRVIWNCGLGPIELRVPRLRHGTYTPSFIGYSIAAEDVETLLHTAEKAAPEAAVLDLLRSLGSHTSQVKPSRVIDRVNEMTGARLSGSRGADNGSDQHPQGIWLDHGDNDDEDDFVHAEEEQYFGASDDVHTDPGRVRQTAPQRAGSTDRAG